MPIRALVLVLLLALAVAAGAQQPFDFAVSGQSFSCGITTPIIRDRADFHFSQQEPVQVDDIVMIAPGPAGTVYGLLRNSAVVRLASNGSSVPFFGGVPGAIAHGIAATPAGRVFITVSVGGVSQLAVVSPAGAQEALYPLPVQVINPVLTVAGDGCTVYYADGFAGSGTAVKRINGCTGAALPDFAALSGVYDVEVLPNGEVLVAADNGVRLYSAAGTFLRTVLSRTAYQAALVNGIVWIVAETESCRNDLLRVSFDTGTEVAPRVLLDPVIVNGLVVGAGSPANVPTAGEVALTLLAFVLAGAGSLVLRLR